MNISKSSFEAFTMFRHYSWPSLKYLPSNMIQEASENKVKIFQEFLVCNNLWTFDSRDVLSDTYTHFQKISMPGVNLMNFRAVLQLKVPYVFLKF